MNFLFVIRRFPQPIKSLYILFFISVIATFIATAIGAGNVALFPVGFFSLLMGLALMTNYKGSADGMANASKDFRPFNVDFSNSPMATAGYSRTFGTMATVFGVFMLVLSL